MTHPDDGASLPASPASRGGKWQEMDHGGGTQTLKLNDDDDPASNGDGDDGSRGGKGGDLF